MTKKKKESLKEIKKEMIKDLQNCYVSKDGKHKPMKVNTSVICSECSYIIKP